jgi:hypothetical protein
MASNVGVLNKAVWENKSEQVKGCSVQDKV